MDRGGEALIGLVVAGGDPAKVLDGAEEVFDQVTPPVHREVARDVARANGLGRNHGEGGVRQKAHRSQGRGSFTR